jgi:hypothetical protein
MGNKKALKKKCKRIKNNGQPCGRWARNGYEVCPNHGAGTMKKSGGRPIKTGLHSKVLKKQLKEKIERYKGKEGLTDLRENIAIKKALLDELITKATKDGKKNLNVATINNAVDIVDAISRDIERLEKIEHGIKHNISITTFHQSVNVIVLVIDRHVRDDKTKQRIFNELKEYGIGKREDISTADVLKITNKK